MDIESTALEIVGSIYDAVGNLDVWPTVLERFADAIGGTITCLGLYDFRSHDGNLALSIRMDPKDQRRYDEYYIGVDCWGIYGGPLVATGKVVTGQMLCPDSILESSEFYSHFLRPLDAFHQIIGIIRKQDSALSFISCLRPKRAGIYEEGEILLLEILLPHLQRAAELHHQQLLRKLHSEALDAMSAGIFFLNQNGKVIFANKIGREILDSKDGLWLTATGILSTDHRGRTMLKTLIQQVSEASAGRGLNSGGSFLISRPSGARPYAVTMMPLHCQDRLFGKDQPSAAIFVADPARPMTADARLQKLFSFTPQEARLVNAMLAGKSLKEAGEQLKISRTTASTHLKHAFAKTGTRRQAELVKVVLRTLGPL